MAGRHRFTGGLPRVTGRASPAGGPAAARPSGSPGPTCLRRRGCRFWAGRGPTGPGVRTTFRRRRGRLVWAGRDPDRPGFPATGHRRSGRPLGVAA